MKNAAVQFALCTFLGVSIWDCLIEVVIFYRIDEDLLSKVLGSWPGIIFFGCQVLFGSVLAGIAALIGWTLRLRNSRQPDFETYIWFSLLTVFIAHAGLGVLPLLAAQGNVLARMLLVVTIATAIPVACLSVPLAIAGTYGCSLFIFRGQDRP